MRKNSRNKGSRFERSVAKAWESWTGYKFSRTPGSGGWAKAKDAVGDLVCTDEKHSRRFPFSIECKSYQDIKFEHLLLGNKTCKIHDFWDQASRDANKINKLPILIMRYNSMPKDEAFFGVGPVLTKWLTENYNLKFMIVNVPDINIGIFMFSEVQKLVKYKDIYKYVRKLK